MPTIPVVGVSWFEALAYCEWLNREQALILPDELAGMGLKIRLPTEDEWEYAARGANSQRYACGDAVSPEHANYEETKLERTTSAGVFKAGEFGLYDMTGNVLDWTSSRWGTDSGKCAFLYGDDYLARKKEQNNLDKMEYRIIRGGSWYLLNRLRAVRDSSQVSSLLSAQQSGFSFVVRLLSSPWLC